MEGGREAGSERGAMGDGRKEMVGEREQWKEGAKKGWREEHVKVEGSPSTAGGQPQAPF